MNKLRKKSMKHEPELCVRIKELRKKAGMTMTTLSEKTHIPVHHLRALEKCEYHKLPEGVYRKAILKKILKALRINPDTFIDELPDTNKTKKVEKPQWKECVSKKMNFALAARVGVFILIVGVVAGYLGVNVYGLLSAPELTINTPQEGQVVSAPQIVIRGQTNVGATVQINGIEVLPTNTGAFEQVIPLREGINSVAIEAKKKFGPKSEITRSITFEPLENLESKNVSLAP